MIVYSATKARFHDDVMTNDIDGIILSAFESATGRTTGKSEIYSWKSSLEYMERVLRDDEIPHDAGIAIEYRLPQTSKRIDFILTGRDNDRRESAVLVELKQWEKAELTRTGCCYDNAITETFFGTLKRELVHHCTFATRQEAQSRIFRYIEGFYNRKRRHSAIGYLAPEQYEQRFFKLAA